MNNPEKIPCAACKEGHYEEVTTQIEIEAAGDVRISIPNVRILRCPKCGDELIPPDAQQQIDRAVAEQTEQLSQRELEDFHERFGSDQTEISETLGLGSKTFHRWLKGTQFPSRSMGYYLRVLAEFPEAFEWLRERGWRRRNRIKQGQLNLGVQFRDLDWLRKEMPSCAQESFPNWLGQAQSRFNPASLFQKTKVK